MSDKIKNNEAGNRRERSFGGILLIVIGALLLLVNVFQWADLGILLLPTLGAIFLIWGFYTHRFGFTVPGCILLGLGTAIFLSERVLTLEETTKGGVIVLGLGVGFLAILFLAPFLEKARGGWAIIPGGILAVIGVLLLAGNIGLQVLQVLGYAWPIIPIAIGVYLLFSPRRLPN